MYCILYFIIYGHQHSSYSSTGLIGASSVNNRDVGLHNANPMQQRQHANL